MRKIARQDEFNRILLALASVETYENLIASLLTDEHLADGRGRARTQKPSNHPNRKAKMEMERK